MCSSHPKSGADSETRTRDILSGNQVFYQLNYARVDWDAAEGNDPSPNWRMKPVSDLLKPRLLVAGGGRVELPRPCSGSTVFKAVSVANLIDLPITGAIYPTRTDDLMLTKQLLYQLS